MKKVNNTLSGRIGAIIFIGVILVFQIYMYPRLINQLHFINKAQIEIATVSNKTDQKIEFTLKDKSILRRDISSKNPFNSLSVGQKVTVKFLISDNEIFLIEGYEDEPMKPLIFLIFILPIIAQAIYLFILFNFFDESAVNFSKRK